ncbi:MAG: ATP-dependent Clp protease ATP-binding subunit [Acidobacteria bacterium]|nr:MAG: ATP-dependent Clp protease ATP-binding subunit [Acidobacteriota bacterium]REJ98713.1 MAG: ATP-dependent Clp protease ATP-binding subunit [Acidobacteriota bacterium]REK16632.1 MAG: ATP-dependent Clp protease ATP-binding subunit [Acidobacteriota bacterium]REK42543.1 MAG: ATP-dependent Clp protease ATP-binding subunit [Acidobacteriota bacterium]
MFERYTEKARRVIFFARYEALQYGSEVISPEHVLLGLMREDKTISARFFPFRHSLTVDTIRREVEERIVPKERIPQSAELHLSSETKRILAFTKEESEKLGSRKIGVEHILLGILREDSSIAAEILYQYGVRLHGVREKINRHSGAPGRRIDGDKSETPNLEEFTRDLTEEASRGRLDPLIGREIETERLIEILCRRTKNNPVLIGESGVGKTAIIEGLAQRIADKNVPSFLENKRILSLDLSLVVAGTKYRGQFEERLKKIMAELKNSRRNIVFIDEIHTLVGAGSAEGSLDAANILKPALSRNEVQCIGATTPREFRMSIEKDRSLERRFQAVKVVPPTEEQAFEIVKGIAERYEAFHQIRYSEDALKAAVYQTNRYIPERFLPDKAIDVLDEAGARAKLRYQEENTSEPSWKEAVENWKKATDEDKLLSLELKTLEDSFFAVEVSQDDVEEVIARWTGIPIQSIKQEEAAKLLKIEDELHKRIVSQRSAISALARAIRRSRAGLKNPKRPVGSFLFLGPTGVGKTEVARTLADFLFGSEKALIRFDMSEYMEKHTVAKFIGSPPGYVGHDEGGQLTEKLRRAPYSIVLFDEVEKAHPDLFNVLLQVFEDGNLTDAQGNEVDCRNALFIMTSNLGARFIQKKTAVGFQANEEDSREKVNDQVMSEVKRTFAPEFINRLDEIILFGELSDEDLAEIIDLQTVQLNKILKQHSLEASLSDEAKNWIIEKTCADRSYGARPIRRAIQKYVEDELSEALIQGKLDGHEKIEVVCGKKGLELKPVPAGKAKNAVTT